MAISDEASKALSLIKGIETYRPQDAEYWRAVATRIAMDLDGAAQYHALRVITAMLREQWGLLGVDPDRAKPLAEVSLPAGELSHLGQVIADLDGYIERRAQDLARPLIEEAEGDAAKRVLTALHEMQRQANLADELRRTLTVRDRELSRLKEEQAPR